MTRTDPALEAARHAQYLRAVAYTNGYLLNRAGAAAGYDERRFFTSRPNMRYASDELRDFFETTGERPIRAADLNVREPRPEGWTYCRRIPTAEEIAGMADLRANGATYQLIADIYNAIDPDLDLSSACIWRALKGQYGPAAA